MGDGFAKLPKFRQDPGRSCPVAPSRPASIPSTCCHTRSPTELADRTEPDWRLRQSPRRNWRGPGRGRSAGPRPHANGFAGWNNHLFLHEFHYDYFHAHRSGVPYGIAKHDGAHAAAISPPCTAPCTVPASVRVVSSVTYIAVNFARRRSAPRFPSVDSRKWTKVSTLRQAPDRT